eukprot:GEMP01010525.1.p1 GENE.GEMP01010525.1~~GEMP01010525.1.p1  ORF type:complete len:549 (+),score=138.71 GEMP01010525.1:886-2532(+)
MPIPVVKLSDDHQLIAFICDTAGDESYTLQFKDLRTQRYFASMANVRAVEFGRANKVFFTIMDDDRRASAVMMGTLNHNAVENITEIVRSDDKSGYHDVFKSKDGQMIFANVARRAKSEVFAVDARGGHVELVAPAQDNVEYFCEHREGRIFVVSNHERHNFKVYVRDPSDGSLMHFYTPPGDFTVQDIDMFHRGLVLYGYVCTQPRVIIIPFDGSRGGRVVPSAVAAGHIEPGVNADFWAPTFRYTIRSPTQSGLVVDSDFHGEVQGGSSSSSVSTEVAERDKIELTSLQVPARDGTYVPLTILGDLTAPGPVLVNVYGAYGSRLPLDYRLDRLQLVKRGWKIAFAHVRGGGEKGFQWHDDGRLLKKHNSFLDFLDTLTVLRVRFKQAQLCGKAESAGAFVLGRALNHGLAANILNVPFLDPVAAMVDESLPLAKMEVGEWGDVANSIQHRDYVEALSPYELTPTQSALYITCAKEDQRVPPFIPLKFAAKQRWARMEDRAQRQKKPPIVVRVLEHGHGGATGDGEQYEEMCREIAFLHLALDLPLT